ncbi:hydrophobic compound transporter HcuA, partial [Enterobacter kobei]|nr:hydrophobic compound transporter HcuA [Enterobacter kobei]
EGRRLVRHTREYLEAGFPVVLGFHGRKGSDIRHWGLAIGMSERAFLLLDPAHDLPRGQAWNAVITSEAHGSRFGYRYINAKGTWAVTLKEMVALL